MAVHHGFPHRHEEHLMAGDNAVNGLAPGHGKVEAYVLVGRGELGGTLKPQHSLGHIVLAVVGASKIIVDGSTLALLCQQGVQFLGFGKVLVGVGRIRLGLDYVNGIPGHIRCHEGLGE